jgi:hypothetical protein
MFVRVSRTTSNLAAPRLVFNRYGDSYFLAQVWTDGDHELHQAYKCKAETQMAKTQQGHQTTVLARR